MFVVRYIKKTIKNLLYKKGYQIFRQYYYDFNADESICKILSRVKVDGTTVRILDVGANMSQSIDRFRKYLPDAIIYSFEPNPNTFEKLVKKQAKDRNLRCLILELAQKKAFFHFL